MALLAHKSPSCRRAIAIRCIVLLIFLVSRFSKEPWQSHGVSKFQFPKHKLIEYHPIRALDQPDNSERHTLDDFWKIGYEESSEVRTCSEMALGEQPSKQYITLVFMITVPEEASG